MEDGGDAILAFCQKVVSLNASSWPPSEEVLANDFVSHFKSSSFLTIGAIEGFCNLTGIKLIKKRLPEGLLACNYFNDGKRVIELDNYTQDPLIQPSTALHEIRELLEYAFNSLDRATMDSRHIEERADEFAFAVLLCEGQTVFTPWIKDALGIESGLLKFGAFGLIGVFAVAVCAQAYFGAVYPHNQDRQLER